MATIDSSLSTLSQIKTKVRRLTRTPSENQLSDSDLENYINTFILYDFPEHLRHMYFKGNFTFYTQPYVDTYENNTTDSSSPLYNFVNEYITFNPPAYIAGYQALWSQSENQFYGIYPKIDSIITLTTGDGSTTSFSGNINTALNSQPSSGAVGLIVAGSVLFGSQDINGLGISLIDYPNPTPSNIMGALAPVGYTGSLAGYPYGQINYLTGDFNLTFTTPPAPDVNINVQCQIVQPSIPQTILFYDGKFKLRPIPDQVYQVTMEAYVRPTAMLDDSDQPLLGEFFQLFAYGAAKKIFEDRMDIESVQMILPEYMKQMNLVNRRTIVQQTTQRTQTIYTEQLGAGGGYSSNWFGGNGGF